MVNTDNKVPSIYNLIIWIVGVFIILLNGFGLWILNDIKNTMFQNDIKIYAKIDRVVQLYNEDRKMILDQLGKVCDGQHDQDIKLKGLEKEIEKYHIRK